MTFTGFPDEAFAFYEGLVADNTKAYWTDHKPTYDACVKAPMEALLAQLEPEFGPATFFRPYRDVRFAKDKTPYKEHAAAVVKDDPSGKSALYVQLGADGLYLGSGYFHTATDQARRLRAAIAEDRAAGALDLAPQQEPLAVLLHFHYLQAVQILDHVGPLAAMVVAISMREPHGWISSAFICTSSSSPG